MPPNSEDNRPAGQVGPSALRNTAGRPTTGPQQTLGQQAYDTYRQLAMGRGIAIGDVPADFATLSDPHRQVWEDCAHHIGSLALGNPALVRNSVIAEQPVSGLQR